MATAAEVNEIIKLYVGYYNRAPDPVGLNFWVEQFDNGFSLDDMAVDFSTQPETLLNYPFFLNPDPTIEEYGTFVDAVYANLFNREPDEGGREFWTTKLDSGEFTVGQVISLIIEGATTSPDQDVVANKVAVGLDFYIETNARLPYEFDDDDKQTATDIQASVTDDPETVADAALLTDAYVASLGAMTINLTTNSDQPGGGGGGVDTRGSSGDDFYSGTIGNNQSGTAQSSDTIEAGGGIDSLDLRVVSTTSPAVGDALVLNANDLEKITVTDQALAGSLVLVNLENVTGETDLTVEGGNENTAVLMYNADEGTQLRMVDVEGGAFFGYKGDRGASNDDEHSLYIENSGSSERTAVTGMYGDGVSETDDEFEILNIETGGTQTSYLQIETRDLETLNITGSQRLAIKGDEGNEFQELSTVDASGMTGGGLFLNADTAEGPAFSFTGSDFNDTIKLSEGLVNDGTDLSLDGGDGIDTLMFDDLDGVNADAVNAATGFEQIEASGPAGSFQASDFTKIDTFIFSGEDADNGRLNISEVTSDDLFIFKRDDGRNDEFLRFEADAVGENLTFEMRANAEDGGEIRLVASGNNNSSAAVGFSGSNDFNEVNIISSGMNDEANVIRAVDGGNGNHYAFDNEGGPSNFVLTGSQAMTITAEEDVALTSNDKESGFYENVNFDASAFTGDLRIAGSNVDDVIRGGSGDDILYGMGGDDRLTGDDGADQFRLSDWSGTDTLIDFVSGEDKVGLQRVDFENTSASVEGTVLDTDDYVENLQNIGNMSSAESQKLVELQLAASQTQIEETQVNVDDAYLLVFNSTSGQGELWYDADWSTTGSNNRILSAVFEDIETVSDLVGLSRTDFVEYDF